MKTQLSSGLLCVLFFFATQATKADTYIDPATEIEYYAVSNGDATCIGLPDGHRDKAIHNLTLLSRVTIGGIERRVTDIAANAFQGCTNLTGNLVIPDTYRHIKDFAFEGCSGFDGTLTLSNILLDIGKNAFQNCSGFKGDLTIPNSVNVIYEYAFDGCSGFDGTLTLSNYQYNERIWDYTFRNCSGFKGELVIPDNIKYIYTYAFQNCSGFEGLTLSNNLISIGQNSFQNCSGMKGELVIPAPVVSISYNVFDGCKGLEKLTFADRPDGKALGLFQYAFYNCTGLKGDLTLPQSLNTLGAFVFAGCSGLDGRLTLSPNTTSIGVGCFSDCSGFPGELIIPEGVVTLNSNAFKNCTGFSSLSLSTSLKSIQSSAFENCSGLKGELKLPATLTTLGTTVFKDCSGLTGTVTIPKTITSLNSEIFENCSGINEFKLHDDITDISFYTFKHCENAKFTIDASDAMSTDASDTAEPLQRLPRSLKSMSTEAFSWCSELKGVLFLPPAMASIGNRCFANTGLTAIVIPADVDTEKLSLGLNFVCDWEGISTSSGLTPLNGFEWVMSLNNNPLPGASIAELSKYDYPLYVHSQAVDAYQSNAPTAENVFPILAVNDIAMTVNKSEQVCYRYQPELTPETHSAILALEVPHKGDNIAWSHEPGQAKSIKPSRVPLPGDDDDSAVIDFDSETLTVTALKLGSAHVVADDGVNRAVAAIDVYDSITGVDKVDGESAEINGIAFALDTSAETTVTVYDVAGRTVYSRTYQPGAVPANIEGLISGTYVVAITSGESKTSAKVQL